MRWCCAVKASIDAFYNEMLSPLLMHNEVGNHNPIQINNAPHQVQLIRSQYS